MTLSITRFTIPRWSRPGVVAAAPTVWQGHLPALDGVRGIAILMVMLLHFRMDQAISPLGGYYLRAVQVGQAGVDLFFVLSGFLITGILFDAKGQPHYFRNFYLRRVLRIFPLYYGFLVVRLLLLPMLVQPSWVDISHPWGEQWWSWFYLTNVEITFEGFSGPPPQTAHFWSLAVEEQFYLVWPLVVFLGSRRTLLTTCVAMFVGAVALRTGIWLLAPERAADAAYVLMPSRMDAFAAGAFVALAARGPSRGVTVVRWHRVAVVIGGVVLLGIFLTRPRMANKDVLTSIVGFAAYAVFFAGLLVMAVTAPAGGIVGRAFTHPLLRFFGKYSYAMYVVHLPLVDVLRTWVLHPDRVEPLVGTRLHAVFAFNVLAVAITAALALASWHLYEKHFLKLKDRFPYGGASRVAERAPATAAPRPASAVGVSE